MGRLGGRVGVSGRAPRIPRARARGGHGMVWPESRAGLHVPMCMARRMGSGFVSRADRLVLQRSKAAGKRPASKKLVETPML